MVYMNALTVTGLYKCVTMVYMYMNAVTMVCMNAVTMVCMTKLLD